MQAKKNIFAKKTPLRIKNIQTADKEKIILCIVIVHIRLAHNNIKNGRFKAKRPGH